MNELITIVSTLFPLVLTNNLLMSAVKWLAVRQESNVFLRSALIVFSALGILATATITGHAVDFNQLTEISKFGLELVVLTFASHFSYKAIKNA